MYEGFHAQKPAIPERNFCQIRYDALVSDPINTLRGAYETLRLGDFDEVASTVDEFMLSKRNYKPNQHIVPPHLAAAILKRCGDYIDRFEYGYQSVAPALKAA